MYGEKTGFEAVKFTIKLQREPLTTMEKTKEIAENINTLMPGKTLQVAADRYLLERGNPDKKPRVFYLRRDLSVGGLTYSAMHENRIVEDGSRSVADELWKAAESLRQSDAQKKSEAARSAATKKFESFGGRVEYVSFNPVASLYGDAVKSESVAVLKELTDIHSLTLEDVPESIQKTIIKSVADLPNITELVLKGEWVKDDVVAQLPERLELLRIIQGKISDQSIAGLTRLKKLQKLSILFTDVSDAILPSLTKIESLKTVEIRSTKVTEVAAEKFKEQQKNLTVEYAK